MKKTIYILGILCCMLIAGGVFLKMNHLKFASITIVLGISSLIFIFLPLALVHNYKNTSKNPGKAFYIITYITLFVLYISSIFKIMHWPGAGKLVIAGVLLPFILFLPVLIYHSRKEEIFTINQTIILIFLLAYISVVAAMLALNVSWVILNATLRVGKQIQQTNYSMMEQLNQAQTKHISGIQELTMSKEGTYLFGVIEDYKNEIIMMADPRNIDLIGTNRDLMNFYGLTKKVSLNNSLNKRILSRLKIKQDISRYQNYLTSVVPDNNQGLRNFVLNSFNTKDIVIEGRKIDWEDYYFQNIQAAWIVTILSQFQTDILLVESELAQEAS